MRKSFDLGDDDGWIDVTIHGVEKRLDLVQCQVRVYEAIRRFQGNSDAHDAIVEAVNKVLTGYGFQAGLSSYVITQFLKRLSDAVGTMRREDEARLQGLADGETTTAA